MPFTVADLIRLAMVDGGALGSGQTPSAEELADGLITLNQIVTTWSRMGRLLYTHAVGQFLLQVNISTYTMGSAGSWNTPSRPVGLQPAALAYFLNFQQGVAVMTMADYERSIVNGQGATATLPSKMGVDEAAPLRNIRVWPTPNAAASIEVPYWLALAEFASTATEINFPVPGYEAALRAELAIALPPMFGRPVPEAIVANLQRYLDRLTSTNALIQASPVSQVQ